MKPTIHLATDHAGLSLKNAIKDWLVKNRYHVHDHGALGAKPDPDDDYPDFVFPAARAVAASRGGEFGIVFGGSGVGEAIAANKVRGIRAVNAYDRYTARMSRMDNDANVLALGGRTIKPAAAIALVKLWLGTKFSDEPRHARRIMKIARYETGRR